jgi:predicted O-linked N-acetylglucosamine transferase (SPINDLY family)
LSTIPELFGFALRHHQAGQLAQAENILRQVVTLDARHGGALDLLGVIAYQSRNFPAAAGYFRQAVVAEPANAGFYNGLGAALQALNQTAEAVSCYRQALQLQPNNACALSNLGIVMARQEQHEEAATLFRQALELDPDDPALLVNLAGALRGQHQLEQAVSCCRKALARRPDMAEAHFNLANALKAQGRLDEAIASYQRTLEVAPGFFPAYHHLGDALQAAGRLEQAIATYHRALQMNAAAHEVYVGLGTALLSKNRAADSSACFRQAAQLQPNNADAYNGLGNAFYSQGNLDEAVTNYQHALALKPDLSPPRYNLGVAYQAQGRLADAQACYRQVLHEHPEDHVAHSTYVGSLNYDPDVEPATLFAEHCRWAERHGPHEPQPAAYDNVADPQRPLRVGYVSPDFRNHAVAYFLQPILVHQDRQKVESICYADVAAPDGMTAHLRKLAGQWRDVLGLSDEQLVQMIRQDRIDILVDLAGHTAHNRLRAFARKPAPIQVSYLGYPCTTGLQAMDYRLGDAVTDPPGEFGWSTEEVVRLSKLFCCYAPAPNAPVPAPSPVQRRGYVTFGSLHKLDKLNGAVLDVWCRILAEAPSSRLLVSRNTLHGQAAAYLLDRLRQRGIETDRIILHRSEPVDLRHLLIYHEIDIALDPFPWNGHTTACECLWMGVPVIALRGKRHAARMVASVLTAAGLEELVAEDPEAYCRKAVALANDRPRLADWRRRLRAMMQASPLCDAVSFTRELEAVYRQWWQRWCGSL